ncbi:MAG: hypothetical protein MJZ19_01420 [Paludibacteraceae bacterium]|nr:hypothetical protein [Paludibacteraceae bacterium]
MNEFFVGAGILVAVSFVFLFIIVGVLNKRRADEVIRGNEVMVERIEKSRRLVIVLGTLLTLLACGCLLTVFLAE